MKKLSKLALRIGIVLVALSLFFSLCLSDVYRLYPDLESVPAFQKVSQAKVLEKSEKDNVVVPVDQVPVPEEGAELVYKFEGSIPSLSGEMITMNNKDYTVIDYATFTTAGGTFKTDKFKTGLETITDEAGTVYNYGTVMVSSYLWDSMNFIQKLSCVVAGVVTPLLILGIVLIAAAAVLAFLGAYQASGKSFSDYMKEVFAKYHKLVLWFVFVILILLALFFVIVSVYSFVNNPDMQDCAICRTRNTFTGMMGGKNIPAALLLLVLGAACALLAVLLNKRIGKDELAAKAQKFISDNAIICGIVLLALFVRLNKDTFFSESNIRNLLSNTAVRFIIAAGVSGCLITKGTDLSAGRMTGFAACVSAIFLQRAGTYANKFYPGLGNLPIIPVLLGVMLICTLLGAINGGVVSILKVPPFIATLGMQTLVYGACMVYTGSEPIGTLQPKFTAIAQGYFGNRMFSFIAIIALCVGLIMWFLYNKTRYGKYMYAIGGNEVAAEVAGINTVSSKIRIYALAAALYALTGFLMASKSGGASVNTAQGYELEAIAGCTIGGVSVNGGVGKISGILVGVLVFELLKIALQWLGIPSEYTYIAQGLVIIVAVALDLRKYLAKK